MPTCLQDDVALQLGGRINTTDRKRKLMVSLLSLYSVLVRASTKNFFVRNVEIICIILNIMQ